MQPGSADGSASAEIKSVPTAEPPAAEFIEVWRPGHRHVRSHSAKRRTARSNVEPSETSPTDVQAGAAPLVPEHEALPEKERRQKRHRRKHRPERPQIGESRDIRKEDTAGRSSLEPQIEAAGAPGRQPARERPARAQRGERPDRDPALRAKYIKGRGGSAAAAQPDPDSPFAKLAKLKEQMEADAKEPP
jgi:ATP-dependent RNA helicase SUPV3L1/SUV3